MKKLLALSLAVVMVLAISVTAFGWNISGTTPSDDMGVGAAGYGHVTPGDTLEIPYNRFLNVTSTYTAGTGYDTFDDAIGSGVKVGDYTIGYTFSAPSKSAIDSIKFDTDESTVVIALKQNYTMSANYLRGNIELKPKSSVTSTIRYTYKIEFVTLANAAVGGVGIAHKFATTYGYATLKSDSGTGGNADDFDITFNYDNLKSLANGKDYITNWGSASGTAMISFGAFSGTTNSQYDDPDFYFEVRVNSSGKMNLSYSTKVVKDITQKYEEAELDFISFPGAPSFDYTGTAKFFTDEERYVYEIKNGALVEVNFSYDDEEECYSWKTRTLGSYVISDVELDTTATSDSDSDSDTTNPDTGANDFVNVAVALAVVSLAAAGAVVLKKK